MDSQSDISYSISGGNTQSLFSINSRTGKSVKVILSHSKSFQMMSDKPAAARQQKSVLPILSSTRFV